MSVELNFSDFSKFIWFMSFDNSYFLRSGEILQYFSKRASVSLIVHCFDNRAIVNCDTCISFIYLRAT